MGYHNNGTYITYLLIRSRVFSYLQQSTEQRSVFPYFQQSPEQHSRFRTYHIPPPFTYQLV